MLLRVICTACSSVGALGRWATAGERLDVSRQRPGSAVAGFVAQPLTFDGVRGRGPAGEQSERLAGLGAGLSGVDHDRQAVGEDFEAVEAELKVPDHRVVELLDALGVQ